MQRVRRTALAIARKLDPSTKPDLLTIELAALLHDVLDKKYVSAAQASDPYAFFLPFFESVKTHVDLISDGRAKHIARIVDNVSWSNESKLKKAGLWTDWHRTSVELHCVQDADRLDAIGAFGNYPFHRWMRYMNSCRYFTVCCIRCSYKQVCSSAEQLKLN